MNSFQKVLNAYGNAHGCHDWEGWVGECQQHPERVVETFMGLRKSYLEMCNSEVGVMLIKLKKQTTNAHWSNTKHQYENLLNNLTP